MSGYFILIGTGVAISCTTSNQRANREHHSDPAIFPCVLHIKIVLILSAFKNWGLFWMEWEAVTHT